MAVPVILAAIRTPFAKRGGAFRDTRPDSGEIGPGSSPERRCAAQVTIDAAQFLDHIAPALDERFIVPGLLAAFVK